MDELTLSPEQQAEVERIVDNVMGQARTEVTRMARLVASKKNSELFGATEFQLRDAVHRIGARVLDSALQERKKRGIVGRA